MRPQLKKGDTVLVIAGKDKGKKGSVISTDTVKNRVVVEGVNMITRHFKKSQARPQGGIVRVESGIQRSNIMLICPQTDKPTRLRSQVSSEGVKQRVSVKSNQAID